MEAGAENTYPPGIDRIGAVWSIAGDIGEIRGHDGIRAGTHAAAVKVARLVHHAVPTEFLVAERLRIDAEEVDRARESFQLPNGRRIRM